jgi:hypothetical protein
MIEGKLANASVSVKVCDVKSVQYFSKPAARFSVAGKASPEIRL